MQETNVTLPQRRLSKEMVTVLAILGAALLYKIVYLTFYAQQMPYYNFPMGDSAIYLGWAQSILHGDFWGLQPDFRVFYRAPLYPYLLAVSLKLFGNSLLPVYIVQMLLGTFNLYLTYVIARRLFTHRAGIAAIVLTALYAPLAFKESKLVSVTLVITLMLIGAWFLLKVQGLMDSGGRGAAGGSGAQPAASGKRRAVGGWWLFLAGVSFGLATIAWGGTIAIVPLLIILWLFPAVRKTLPEPKHAFRSLVLILLGWFLMVLPVTLHNLLVGNDFVLVNSNSGYTFYQGNNPAASGTIVHPPEVYEQAYGGRFPTSIGDQQAFDLGYASSKLYPPKQGEKSQVAKPSETSAFWLKRGLTWIASNPGQFVRLEFQKLVLMLSNYEFASNYYFDVELNEVPVLRILFMPFAIIFALGLAGILSLRKGEGRKEKGGSPDSSLIPHPLSFSSVWPLHLVIVTTVLTLLVFYVGTRYRLPLILPLAVFAGKTVDDVLSRWQKKQVAFAQLGVVVVALIVSWILCVVPMTGRMHFITALGYRNLGENYHTQAGNAVKGEEAYHKGLALFDASSGFGRTTLALNAEAELHVLLGNALLDQQKYDSAIANFQDAQRIDARMTDALSRLAVAYYTKALKQAPSGQAPSRALLDTARDYAGQYRDTDTLSVPANALLGDIYAARQNRDSALQIYRYMTRLDTLNAAALMAVADIEMFQHDTVQALSDLTRAAGIDSFNLVPILKLGLAYGVRGNHAGVQALLGAAVDRVERNPMILQAALHSQAFSSYIDTKYYLAIADLNLQEWDLAASQAEAILKMVPDHKAAQQLLQDAHNHKPTGKPQ